MRFQLIRTILFRLGEVIAVVVLALVFFSIFLTLLRVFFPLGSGMQDASRSDGLLASAGIAERSVREMLLSTGDQEVQLGLPGEGEAAVLTRLRNVVKSKRMGAIAWGSARAGMSLYERDAVQTFSRSGALIRFDEENLLDMGENSLVIIRRLEQDPIRREKRSFLVMVDGELRGKIKGMKNESIQVEVAMPTGITRIRSKEGAEAEAEFKISVNPDQSATISVYQGEAEVISEGKSVAVEANQSSTVKKDQAPEKPVRLPEPPILREPHGDGTFVYRDLPPQIQFRWVDPDKTEGYRFVLARNADFSDIVDEELLSKPGFMHGNLKGGNYYWRVSAREGSREGRYSPARRFHVIQDLEAPRLEVAFPPEIYSQEEYTLKGITEPGARVFIGGEMIPINGEGRFSYLLRLQHGINVVVVESVDEAGNVSYRSRLVNGKF